MNSRIFNIFVLPLNKKIPACLSLRQPGYLFQSPKDQLLFALRPCRLTFSKVSKFTFIY